MLGENVGQRNYNQCPWEVRENIALMRKKMLQKLNNWKTSESDKYDI